MLTRAKCIAGFVTFALVAASSDIALGFGASVKISEGVSPRRSEVVLVVHGTVGHTSKVGRSLKMYTQIAPCKDTLAGELELQRQRLQKIGPAGLLKKVLDEPVPGDKFSFRYVATSPRPSEHACAYLVSDSNSGNGTDTHAAATFVFR